jgi:hypothetical protein
MLHHDERVPGERRQQIFSTCAWHVDLECMIDVGCDSREAKTDGEAVLMNLGAGGQTLGSHLPKRPSVA